MSSKILEICHQLLRKHRLRFAGEQLAPAKGAYVGLAPPGEAGSWQTECKVNCFDTFSSVRSSYYSESDGDMNIGTSIDL